MSCSSRCGACASSSSMREIAKPTWMSTQSPGPAPAPSSPSSRPMLTLRVTPATSTLASRLGSSTTATTWPGMARHIEELLAAGAKPRRGVSYQDRSRGASPRSAGPVERLVDERVGAGILGAGDRAQRPAAKAGQRLGRAGMQRAHVGVLDLVDAVDLLGHELRVVDHVDLVGAERLRALQAEQQRAVLGDVVGRDAEQL